MKLIFGLANIPWLLDDSLTAQGGMNEQRTEHNNLIAVIGVVCNALSLAAGERR